MSAGETVVGSVVAQKEPQRPRARHVDTAICCAVVLLSGIVPGAAFMVLLTVPFVAPWLVYVLVSVARRPSRWQYQGIKAASLTATVSLLFVAQAIYAPLARQAADDARQGVLHFHAVHGTWPRNLEEAGLSDATRFHRWNVVYFADDGNVMYLSTFNGFDRWWRGPDDVSWNFMPD